ncbi:hypothetical protein IP84_06995 [beta proteobacterium AAP99]|nr:hypothetical protein IP84_06995 [beta proteobacterium AAP99]
MQVGASVGVDVSRFAIRAVARDAPAVTVLEVEAQSAEHAQAQATARGYTVLSVARLHQPSPVARGLSWPTRRRSDAFVIGWWCKELRTLVGAGLTIVEALDTLRRQAGQGERAVVLDALIGAIERGKSLSAAMREAGRFPPVLIASIQASERTSTLVQALDDYITHDEMLAKLRKQVVSAAIYPAVVVGLGGVITLFLLGFVLPRFSRVYESFQTDLSWATRAVLAISKLLAAQPVLVIGVAACVVVALGLGVRSGRLLPMVLSQAERVRALRDQADHFRLTVLYQSLGLMFRGGYAIDEAIAVCLNLNLGAGLRQRLSEVRHALSQGRALSVAFADAGLTDYTDQRLMAAAERTGHFGPVLSTLSMRHAEAFQTFVQRATRLVEPALLLAVALVVGGIVVLMYLPIFDLAGSLR